MGGMNLPNTTAGLETAARESFIFQSSDELQAISEREGIDAATTKLYQALLDSPQHRRFIQRIEELSRGQDLAFPPPTPPSADTKLVIVPGAFYRENPNSGADGHVVREEAERLGWKTDLIPVASTGSLQENARVIVRWLGEHRDFRIVLVSLSKGGPDVKMALSQPDAERAFGPVVAWLNLCGLLSGTPLVDWLFSGNARAVMLRLYCRLRRQSLLFAHDLRRGSDTPLDFHMRLPAQVQMISVVGFPLRRHLTNGMALYCHRQLSSYGPNDGGLVLADVCELPGVIYPVWGADHYLRSGTDMDRLVGALLRFVGQELAACPSPQLTTLANK
jgi:hypothetical protein